MNRPAPRLTEAELDAQIRLNRDAIDEAMHAWLHARNAEARRQAYELQVASERRANRRALRAGWLMVALGLALAVVLALAALAAYLPHRAP